ncbi:MAG: helicase [Phylliscum demangeonii]|nr:MAG: helicase [Phylliscum demangeonii]
MHELAQFVTKLDGSRPTISILKQWRDIAPTLHVILARYIRHLIASRWVDEASLRVFRMAGDLAFSQTDANVRDRVRCLSGWETSLRLALSDCARVSPAPELYEQNGEERLDNAQERQGYAQGLREARDHAITRADVIVCTCNNTAEGYLFRNFNPDVIYLDEGARATELDLVISLAAFEPRAIILVGDNKPLRPVALSYKKRTEEKRLLNCFAPQILRSTRELG